jgi:hypothetical protein
MSSQWFLREDVLSSVASAVTGNSEIRSVRTAPSSSNNATVATVVHQIMTELSEAASQEDRIMVTTNSLLQLSL